MKRLHETPQRGHADLANADQAHAPGKQHLERHETSAAHEPRQSRSTLVDEPVGRKAGQRRGR
jgi:hypothetical protein